MTEATGNLLPDVIEQETTYRGANGQPITETFILRHLTTFEGYSKSIRSDPRTAELTLSIGVPVTSRHEAYVVDERPGTMFTIVVYERVAGQELDRGFIPDHPDPDAPVRLTIIRGEEYMDVDGYDLEDGDEVLDRMMQGIEDSIDGVLPHGD